MVKGKGKHKTIAVAVAKFGSDEVALNVAPDSTVGDILEQADITLNGREKVYCNGAEVDMDDKAEDGDVFSIVTPKAAGLN